MNFSTLSISFSLIEKQSSLFSGEGVMPACLPHHERLRSVGLITEYVLDVLAGLKIAFSLPVRHDELTICSQSKDPLF